MAPPRQPPAQRSSAQLIKCIAGILLALIVLTGLVFLIIWLSVQPKKLKYSIEHGSINQFNFTNDVVNANFHFVLRANNPNKRISLYYDKINVWVMYEDQELSENDVRPFYQRRRNVTFVDLDLTAKNASVYGAVGRDLRIERSGGEVELDVKIRAKIRLKIGVFKIHRTLKVLCESLTVPFDSRKGFERVACDASMS